MTKESVLEGLSKSICDSHTHLWNDSVLYPSSTYARNKVSDGSSENLIELMKHFGIKRAAVITPQTLGFDNRLTLQIAKHHGELFIPVVRIDTKSHHLLAEMKSLIDQGGRGIRITLLGEVDLSWLVHENLNSFWRILESAEIPVSIHCRPDQCWILGTIAKEFPQLIILLDHFGRINILNGTDSVEFHEVLSLANFENVYLKCSSTNNFSHVPGTHSDLAGFISVALEKFSAKRLLWGSDWPFCVSQGSYADSFAPLFELDIDSDLEPLSSIMGGNFERIYCS
jgi:L-fuconolactonase